MLNKNFHFLGPDDPTQVNGNWKEWRRLYTALMGINGL